jgi:hypothetical protein
LILAVISASISAGVMPSSVIAAGASLATSAAAELMPPAAASGIVGGLGASREPQALVGSSRSTLGADGYGRAGEHQNWSAGFPTGRRSASRRLPAPGAD